MENRFRVILAYRKKTVSDVHFNTGISKTTLFNLYHNRTKNPELRTLLKISDYLNVTVDELLGIREEVN